MKHIHVRHIQKAKIVIDIYANPNVRKLSDYMGLSVGSWYSIEDLSNSLKMPRERVRLYVRQLESIDVLVRKKDKKINMFSLNSSQEDTYLKLISKIYSA